MATNNKTGKPAPAIVNRRARFDYALGDEVTAGLELTGPEVRAARGGHIGLKGAFVTIRNGELWLNNASFTLKLNRQGAESQSTVDTRARKLLLKKREIEELEAAKQTGLTIVPTRLLTAGRFIKVVIATAKGKKNYDKREVIKRRDQERETRRGI